ncbi:MAG TPA: SMC family ATPase [Nocardioides sp.]|nr:SMC family ATPase [Nocardioides sp.]
MRLHHLQVEAFGPFAQRVTVDFDALSAAGLFLLTGATGAGKTSILDAVCFALYGEVPGDRQSAKRLRADQAADGDVPRVTLELTLAGRRFRIVRSPAWQRPKKRGVGTTPQQASVKLCERREGAWHPLSTRLDEAGHQITQLVGLNLTQFCQVALLPQGRFQAFLRARSEQRHKLLQQLFRTARFEAVERWLADRRRSLRDQSRDHHDRVADLVSRLSEAASSPLPQEWDPHDLTRPADEGEIARWAADRRREAAHAARAAAAHQRAALRHEDTSCRSLEAARRLHDDQRRHAEALAERARLDRSAPQHARRVAQLGRAQRAAAVAPLVQVADEHAEAADRARACCVSLREAAAALLGVSARELDETTLAEARDRSIEHATLARALLPREAELGARRAGVEVDSSRVRELAEEQNELTRRLSLIPDEIKLARQRETEARDSARDLAHLTERADSLRVRREAAERAVAVAGELAAASDLHRQAVDEAQQLKERWLGVQEQRIRGIAAELAHALVVGDACPVCGSAEHPRPADPDSGAPDAAAEKAARKLVDDAEAARHARHLRVRELTSQLEAARSTAAGDLPALSLEVAEAEARLQQCAALAESVAERQALVADAEARQVELAERRDAVVRDLTALTASLERQRCEVETVERELEDLLSGSGCETLTSLGAMHDQVADSCAQALSAIDDLRRADETVATVRTQLAQAAVNAGFTDADAATRAVLGADSLERLTHEIRLHDRAAARVEETLAEPGLRERAALAPPDLAGLEATHTQAVTDLSEATTGADVARTRSQRVTGLGAELASALDAWSPVRAEHGLVTRMAALADGTSADNRLRMRLSAYVLASRLAQVVAAANVRLTTMSDRRYALEHTGGRGAGESRGGLSLLVRDEWSGEARDPATLSGGETFVVSLALALGLADVIAHEVGGTDLDTLFVDEGFGSLDADTLDDVMDTLDTLREGGRVVGVVSHVAHLRERIPTQLHVEKGRHGSSVRTVHAG